MPERSRPPYRAEQIGSLLRTPAVFEARTSYESGKVEQKQLTCTEDEGIKTAVALQKELGLKTLTDGEYRRTVFFQGFQESLDGIEIVHGLPLDTLRSYMPTGIQFLGLETLFAPLVVGKIKRVKPFYLTEFAYMKSLVDEADIPNIKITMCSPVLYDFQYGEKWVHKENKVYSSRAELFADLAQCYREEIADLYAAGCRNIQLDEPLFTFLCYPPTAEGFKEAGLDPAAVVDEYVAIINSCLKDVPEDMTVGVHLCRGNFRGHGMVEGGYDPIAKQLFTNLNVDCFYLEYDTDRSGDFAPLAHLPADKIAVLGIVSTKVPKLESVEHITARLEEAIQVILTAHPERTRDQVLDHPQCGFASEMTGNPISWEDMKNKFTLVSDAATQFWSC